MTGAKTMGGAEKSWGVPWKCSFARGGNSEDGRAVSNRAEVSNEIPNELGG